MKWMATTKKIVNILWRSKIVSFTRPRFFRTNSDNWMHWKEEATLYVHWPFCAKRCSYCNFNKYISNNVDHNRMRKCFIKEAKTLLQVSNVKQIKSIFFGGGTPSLAEPDTIQSILSTVSSIADIPGEAEITLEVNPTDLESASLRNFQAAGINRVSIGIQSLKEEDLFILGRQHTVAESLRCLEEARSIFPGRCSVDVIFGRPGQTLDDWILELEKILQICDNHISLYQLTLERGTSLFKQAQKNIISLPSTETQSFMYEEAVKILEDEKFMRYEASNFAKEGHESQHNKAYWRGDQYIGIGPGAHGRFVPGGIQGSDREARIQTLEPEPWMWEVEHYGHGTRKIVTQSMLDILSEVLALGMRTTEGITEQRWQKFSGGVSLNSVFQNSPAVHHLQSGNFIHLSDKCLTPTHKGLSVADSIVPELLNILADFYNTESQTVTYY